PLCESDYPIVLFIIQEIVRANAAPVRQATAYVDNPRQTIRVLRRIRAHLLPALVASDGPVVHAHGPIPWQPQVPLHVAVETEKLAQIIHAQVRWIAPAGGDALPLRSIRRDAEYRRLA